MNWPELVLNAVFEGAGPIVFKYACAVGCEGIISKRRVAAYGARCRVACSQPPPRAEKVFPRIARHRRPQRSLARPRNRGTWWPLMISDLTPPRPYA